MTCDQCGCATELVDSTDHTESGPFREEYECVNGHKGFVTGREEEPPQNWNRYGAIFDNEQL
jgi:hypothetical protein